MGLRISTFNDSFESIYSNDTECLAQDLKHMHSVYGNSIIIQDDDGRIAKRNLEPLLAFPSYLKEMITTHPGGPYGPTLHPYI